MFPAHGHFPRLMRHPDASQFTRKILDEAALLVVRNPVLKIMQSGRISSVASPRPVPVQLDII
jgi:hypothetical protein